MNAKRLALVVAATLMATQSSAQTTDSRWTVDPSTSLVWWQMNPHLGHLWATTCPQDPSWQAGEGRTMESLGHIVRIKTAYADHEEKRIPLYPRQEVQPVCTRAVSGEMHARDTVRWSGVRATVTVRPEHLITGQRIRDDYGKKRIFEVDKYPEIRFVVDSIVGLRAGQPATGNAVGTLELRGVRTPLVVPVTVSREAHGLRVRGRFDMAADELVKRYKVSGMALGLSVGQRIWRTLHMGFDLVLRPGG